MPIDKNLAEILGLDQATLAKRSKTERNWLERLLVEVVEPFDHLLQEHQEQLLAGTKEGLTVEALQEAVKFNRSLHEALAMMVALYVVSNWPPDEKQLVEAIGLTVQNLRYSAERICLWAKEAQAEKREERGQDD